MSFSVIKRSAATVIALLFLIILIISPMIGLKGEHDHGCSPNDCLICLVANTLSGIRELFAFSRICTIAIIFILCVCGAVHGKALFHIDSSPIALKTKILS